MRSILPRTGHPVLPAAPPRIHPVGHPLHDRLDLVDLAVLDPEGFRDLPGPRLLRTCGYGTPIGRLERPRVASHVVEKYKAEYQPPLWIHRDEAPIPDARHEVQQSRLELLTAAPLTRVHVGCLRVRPRLSRR